jgi:phospholipase C
MLLDPKHLPGGLSEARESVTAAPQAGANLNNIQHIVVLMLENRSFDHMLGYLKLEGGRTDVDGLTSDMANVDNRGVVHRVHHLPTTALQDDPGHEAPDVHIQLTERPLPAPPQAGQADPITMGGFVKNFQSYFTSDPGQVMGYYNARDLPTYDFLAANFCVCDRWFAAVPGPTWVNRMFAIAGSSGGLRTDHAIPGYNPGVVVMQKLDEHHRSWKWYYSDAPTLPLLSLAYAPAALPHLHTIDEFFEDVSQGVLPDVSWIEPNYIDFGLIAAQNLANSNDDHPPVDITHGQRLVARVVRALFQAPGDLFKHTLLIVTYDEHGGFFDHVAPPEAVAEPASDPFFARYGVRVPAFIVTPWVAAGSVSHALFDHTSIIKTILVRFCMGPGGAIPYMGRRVAAAQHLGGLLTESTPRPTPTFGYSQSVPSAPGRAYGPGVASVPGQPAPAQLNALQRGLLAALEHDPTWAPLIRKQAVLTAA